MILNSNPGNPREYPCFVNLPPLLPNLDGRSGFISRHIQTMSPKYIKKDEFEAYEFVVEGIHYIFIISVPRTWNVKPSIERKRLTIGFTSIQNQERILEDVMQILEKRTC
jgi:hypothetical protein